MGNPSGDNWAGPQALLATQCGGPLSQQKAWCGAEPCGGTGLRCPGWQRPAAQAPPHPHRPHPPCPLCPGVGWVGWLIHMCAGPTAPASTTQGPLGGTYPLASGRATSCALLAPDHCWVCACFPVSIKCCYFHKMFSFQFVILSKYSLRFLQLPSLQAVKMFCIVFADI